MSLRCLYPVVVSSALLAGCAGPGPVTQPPPAASRATPVEVVETYVSEARPGDGLDSLATWVDEAGGTRVIATARATHRLVVFDGDSGERLDAAGGPGDAPGTFRHPDGIATFGDLVFVAERDASRVQVLRMPALSPVAVLGASGLRSPHGVWLHETAPDVLEVYVAEGVMSGADHPRGPPAHEPDPRVRRYRLELDADTLHATALGHFGRTDGPGLLHTAESIAGDPANGTLLIAGEDRRAASTLYEYTLEGAATGRNLPADVFARRAGGIALWSCGLDAGYWIAADPVAPHTVFHVIERDSLVLRGSFHGRVTANTDGIALHAAATPRFPAGALYAVHDDRALTAFDLRQVAAALDLPATCAD